MVRHEVETLVRLMRTYRPSAVERMQDWFLQVTTAHTPLLHQVLRFIAVLPSLRLTSHTARRCAPSVRKSVCCYVH